MEQIIEYSNVKVITDITKTFASIPCTAVVENNKPKFTIANYDEFKKLIERLTSDFTEKNVVITDKNIASYENDASSINKLIKQVKKDCQDFVDEFALSMLGKGGRKPIKGQVQEIQEILQKAYDTIHAKTTEFREAKKIEEQKAKAIDVEVKNVKAERQVKISVLVSVSKVEAFEKYCKENGISILERY